MKFTVIREDILKYLQLISGAVERRQTLAILSNVLLSAHDGKLSFTATDLEIELVGRLNINKIDDPGEITVSARKLLDICKTLPAGADISFSTAKDRLNIKSGKSRFSLSTLPANEFPNLEEMHSIFSFSLPQKAFKELIESTYFSMAQQDVRYYLNGMLFHINQGVMRVVSTDGHRLSLGMSERVTEKNDEIQIIVPRKGILELMRLLDNNDDEVKLAISTNHICAATPLFTFTSKLIEGKFPDFNRVIPKNGNKIAIIDREKFKDSLTRVSILSNDKYRGIRMRIIPEAIKIFAINPEQDEAEDEVEIDYKGAEIEIGFNVNYLFDICNTVSSKNIKFTFSDSDSSILIEPSELDSNENYLYVIMPMRI